MIRFLTMAVFAMLLGAAGGILAVGGQPFSYVSWTAAKNDNGAEDEITHRMRDNVERSTL